MSAVQQCPPVPSPGIGSGLPGIGSGLLDSWFDGYAAAVNGFGRCFTTALRRGPGALDFPRWIATATRRTPPSWSTPHEIVFEAPLARLRDFSVSGKRIVPTLVLPPQAGHDSCIVDYSPAQSQMGAILDAGLERAFSLDWIGATRETKDASIEDYMDLVDRAVEHCGGRVNLIGDCQGGWLATIYAALHPERVNTLTIAGAPIDFHAGEPVIHEVLRRVAPDGDLRFYEALVAMGGGVLQGRHMLAGFIMIQPGAEIARQIDLLLNLDDPAHVARYREFEDWFKHTQDFPGAFYLWIVRHLFRDNGLIGRSLEVRGKKVDLATIDMPLNLMAGAVDHITPPDQVFALATHASTPPEHVTRHVSTGGHLGLFMGHEALREHWPRVLTDVFQHSRAGSYRQTTRSKGEVDGRSHAASQG
ncbi:MAG: alpha/beta fold hydrolase [Solirubrobacterales bacterium]|nr:alpha/beta fold hydrolase [Solirubrobacterales bacterium]